jgi:hypothetical protein
MIRRIPLLEKERHDRILIWIRVVYRLNLKFKIHSHRIFGALKISLVIADTICEHWRVAVSVTIVTSIADDLFWFTVTVSLSGSVEPVVNWYIVNFIVFCLDGESSYRRVGVHFGTLDVHRNIWIDLHQKRMNTCYKILFKMMKMKVKMYILEAWLNWIQVLNGIYFYYMYLRNKVSF